MLDSVIKAKKKYYLQTLLEKCKYKQKIEKLIDDDFENQIVNLMMKKNLILIMIMIMMTNSLLKVF